MNEIYLCFDIGATTTKFVYIKKDSLEIIHRGVFDTKESNQIFEVKYLIKNVLKEIDDCLKNNHVVGIGIASAGGVDIKKQQICHVNDKMKNYLGTNWKEIVADKYKIKTVVLNDVKAAGICEFKDKKNLSGIMITLGTGLGASFFINGNIYLGSKYLCGEVGQMIWPFDNTITADDACSAVIATNKIRKIIKDDSFKLTEDFKIKNILQALEIKINWMKNVAYMLQVLDYLFDPEIFVIGGGVSKHKELIFDVLKYLPKNFKPVELAKNANDAAFFGLINYLKQ